MNIVPAESSTWPLAKVLDYSTDLL